MKKRLLLVVLLCFCGALVSDAGFFSRKPKEPDTMDRIKRHFDSISALLEQADRKREKGDIKEARKLYGATIAAYQDFHRKFPDANVEIIKFRISYCRNQIIKLLAEETGAPTNSNAVVVAEPTVASVDTAKRMSVRPSQERPPVAAHNSVKRGGVTPSERRSIIIKNTVLCQNGKYKDVDANMRAFIKKHPNDSQAWLLLGTAQVGLGNLKKARKYVDRAIQVDPSSSEAHYDYCQILLRASPPDFKTARLHYKKALELGAPPDNDLKMVLNL